MQIKWFFVVWGFIFTILLASALYLIATNISTQSYKQYEEAQNRSMYNFNQSILIHDSLFDNITDLKKGLDPILAQVDNASEMRFKQDLHYNQTTQDFETIKEIIDLKKQDHDLLVTLNKSFSQIADRISNLTNGVEKNSNNPVIINNGTPVPVGNISNSTTTGLAS